MEMAKSRQLLPMWIIRNKRLYAQLPRENTKPMENQNNLKSPRKNATDGYKI